MNFLDTYDIARSTTPIPATQPEQPSLNEEVNQVIGQLGRFWGGFRKQSQVALETARKDFSEVVVQAQKELSKFTAAEAEVPQETNETTDKGEGTSTAARSSTSAEEASTSEPSAGDASTSSGSTTSLFSRMQAALPPNIVATVQNNIPESLKHASENIDLQQIRTNLLSELQRVQGVTLAQAEEYAHKSEALLREAVKEAGEVLRDAVKVLPPDQAGPAVGGSSLMWDGTDMWMLPSDPSESTVSGTGKDREAGGSSKGPETQTAVASRAEALLRRLKRDPTIIRHDPEVEEGVKDQYLAWREKEVDILDGGAEGAAWSAMIDAALEDTSDGQTLKHLEETLVPSEMTRPAFWLRFFFRTHQIRMEEEKRKALIRSTTENEEEFSWEDEEEEESSPATTKKAQPGTSTQNTSLGKTAKDSLAIPAPGPVTEGLSSPRVSSEDSFDLISGANSVAGDEKPPRRKDDDNDGDSDWE
ncbi:hypothetical protein GALMADRAFT_248422 [Galerina marginata CBS 339.88]|uniref:BSD domain-containing protein n=1 Tax=Galerina marginata (strain CBS 339.88) TaxID=685588 RepID=A0A067SXR5_GALM3|nr:hypothetical protein GALMADRAFT_248422 [Galerina marginata CBS 339.88]